MDAANLERTLSRAPSLSDKLLWLGALLRASVGGEIIVVGGSAIEIYSRDQFVSEDIDVVGDRERIASVLSEWGFVREGRLWSLRKLNLWVDPVGKDYSGDRRKLREFKTPFGPVKLASVEDLIAKRLIELAVWPKTSLMLFEQALALAVEYGRSIDWDYVEMVAKRDGATGLLDELTRAAKPLESTKSSIE